MLKITGTFVQPLCGGDIPAMDWRYEEWDAELALMKKIGIDTIILLRQMLGPFAAYNSKYLKSLHPNMWEPSFDYLKMFLDLCEKHEMKFWIPTYNPGHDWLLDSYDPEQECKFLIPLIDELMEKCGSSPAFEGWYFAHEISRKVAWRVIDLFRELGPYCKKVSGGKPIMMSPGVQGPKGLIADLYPPAERKARSVTFEQHREEWDWMLSRLQGAVDIVAFQDGHADYEDLETFQKINVELCTKYGIESWSNIESFDRDIRNPKFQVINWEKMRFKMNSAERAGCTKFITFEFVPFLSPNACYPAAKYLLRRYLEETGIENPGV